MLAITSLVSASCHGTQPATVPPPQPSPLGDRVLVQLKDLPKGLDLKLTAGAQGPAAIDRATLAPAVKLADADAQALLGRAAPLASDPDDQQPFALRPGSSPPPRTGETIRAVFPPASSSSSSPPPRSNDAHAPLHVVRYMPEGKLPIAPRLSVTFDQPMVAMTSQDEAAKVVPVELVPQPKGQWRWIGTRTIVFDPDVRFPQATTYRATIPAGTKSATGNALAKAVSFSFQLPAPTIARAYPTDGEPRRLDQPIFVRFDQRIDRDAVLAHVALTANGVKVPFAPMSDDDIAQEQRRDASFAPELTTAATAATADLARDPNTNVTGRYIALRPAAPLPTDAAIEVAIGAGTPSSEGPNTTPVAQSAAFRTYAPLALKQASCGECFPDDAAVLELNNPVADDDKLLSRLAFAPAVSGLAVAHYGNAIYVTGAFAAHTAYRVTIAAALTDRFGQTLGHDVTATLAYGAPRAALYGPQNLTVLDPAAKIPGLDVFSAQVKQLRVRLYKVEPGDYGAWLHYLETRWDRAHAHAPPGALASDLVIAIAQQDHLVETHVDLRAALAGGLGDAIAVIEPVAWPERGQAPRIETWVQSTRLAVDAYTDADRLVAFATELGTGKPLANVQLTLEPYHLKAATDAGGVASISLAAKEQKGASYLVARRGGDTAFVLDQNGWAENGTWFAHPHKAYLRAYVTDDRRMYKPGEEVHVKGWLRRVGPGPRGDLEPAHVAQLAFVARDTMNVELAKGTATVDAAGGFDAKLAIPTTANLGGAAIVFKADGGDESFIHGFQIQEFRRPEFEVGAKASQGPFVARGGAAAAAQGNAARSSADVTVSAKYYSGGPLPGAPVEWSVTASPTTYTPPNRDDFAFGRWRPWWSFAGWGGDDAEPGTQTWSLAGATDARGEHVAHLDFASISPPQPMSVAAHASVTDVNRQAWVASQTLLVHPALRYVGLRAATSFVEQGKPFDVDAIGVDLDGKATPGAAIEIKAERLAWKLEHDKVTTERVEPQVCRVTAAADPVACHFATPHGGSYELTATIADADGRPNQTTYDFWVSGGESPPARDVEQEQVQLVPDRKQYAAGDTAHVLVQAPFYPADGVVAWERDGIMKLDRIALTGPSATIAIPIDEAMVPNLFVHVDLVGAATRIDERGKPDPALPKRPAYAGGTLQLMIPPARRTLAVAVKPAADKVAPGEPTRIDVSVRDAAGKPVAGAETAVIVVDEAVLAVAGAGPFEDPIAAFYEPRAAGVAESLIRRYVTLARPDAAALAENGVTTTGAPLAGATSLDNQYIVEGINTRDATKAVGTPPPPPPAAPMLQVQTKNARPGGAPPAAIAVRANFDALAAFAPAVTTGADGIAHVAIKMPDSLTRYRIVALASAPGDRSPEGRQFGKGESAITARLPLMVRPSAPRFLNFGDTFRLPVVVQNQTDSPLTVKLALRATNAAITDGAGREVTVPANDRVEVQFAAAAARPGTARFQIIGSAGTYSDAAEVSLPVWTPATTEAFATYGVIDSGAIAQPVALPPAIVPSFGALEISTASTNLQALTDALLYLVHYPFDCAEQRSSRIAAIAALRDVLEAFHTKDLPGRAELEASVADDVKHLQSLQNWDGGFGYWQRGEASDPYLSVYVANALARAKAKGFAVPEPMLRSAGSFLAQIESHYPSWYAVDVKRAISAYALYTRSLLGARDVAKATHLVAEAGADKLPIEAAGWLLATLAGEPSAQAERAALVRFAQNRVAETAGAANFTTGYGDGNYLLLASDRRADAVMLDALIAEQPASDLIPKLVTGLLAHRTAGRWTSTQENAFALGALDRYFRTYEKTTPDFVARLWLGGDYAGDHAFKGRQTDRFAVAIPLAQLATPGHGALTLQKDGQGRMYYRIGMTYAPASLQLAPADRGFVVQRTYEDADGGTAVSRAADGTWHVKAGARVRVRVQMVTDSRRYRVALVDPLPAGFEAMNPALAVTGPVPEDPKAQQQRGVYWWFGTTWFDHQNMRDERVEAFATIVWEGVHDYSYVARATTPGAFVVPPPKAEEMYAPETFGRGASDRVIVE